MDKNQKIFLGIVGLVVIILAVVAVVRGDGKKEASGPGVYDEFAMCLADKGATFYGAFWCPHCKAQKKLFGSSEKLLPYVECSTPDGNNQTQICIDNNIETYPTWEFADGSRLSGEIPLEQLSEKTGCPIFPEDNDLNSETSLEGSTDQSNDTPFEDSNNTPNIITEEQE